jgi:chromate transporter
VFATCVFLALNNFHQRLIPVILVSGPLAMAWYWPRRGKRELQT